MNRSISVWVLAGLALGMMRPALLMADERPVQLCTETEMNNPKDGPDETGVQWIVKQSFASLHWPMQLERLSWQKCLQSVIEGRMDGLFAIIRTPERAAQLAFPAGADSPTPSSYLWRVGYYIFENRQRPFDSSDVKFGVGAPLGYVVYQALREQGLLSSIDYSLREGLRMVARGRLDGYLVGKVAGMSAVEELGLEARINMRPETFMVRDVHVAFNPAFYQQHAERVERFWQKLNHFREEAPKQAHLNTTRFGKPN